MAQLDLSADNVFAVSDLSLSYGASRGRLAHDALIGLNFTLPRGGVLAVLGESGSGKSTLARFLAGRGMESGEKGARIQLTGGDARVLGVNPAKLNRRGIAELTYHVGYLGQEDGAKLPPELNVGDILLSPLAERTRDIDYDVVGGRIAEMLEIVELPLGVLQQLPHELSKGQRQRVALVRGLMLQPAVVVADEPTLGVDANVRPRIVELLRWYRQKHGAAMLLVTHDIGMLEVLAQEVLVLQQGYAVGLGGINEIFRRSNEPYVQQLAQALRRTAYDEIAGG